MICPGSSSRRWLLSFWGQPTEANIEDDGIDDPVGQPTPPRAVGAAAVNPSSLRVVTADKLERAKALLAKGLTVREAANAPQDRKVRALLYEALNLEPTVDARAAYIAIGNTKC